MIPVELKDLPRFIAEGEAAGKDVNGLKHQLNEEIILKTPKTRILGKGGGIYFSTGPVRPSDFQ